MYLYMKRQKRFLKSLSPYHRSFFILVLWGFRTSKFQAFPVLKSKGNAALWI